MKKIKIFVALMLSSIGFVLCMNPISAKSIYYVNSNGVQFTEDEYNFLSLMFWDGCQDLMSEDDYKNFINSDIMNGEIDASYLVPIIPYGTTISTSSKTLKIVKSCSSNCLVSVTATWKTNPSVRSYDVIGAYLSGTSLVNTPSTSVTTTAGTSYSQELKKFDNGFGVSIALPSGSSVIVNQTFRVKKGGHVYASYQHATKNISLANSKNYTISFGGYGNVFAFSGVASTTYDRMSGVDIFV